jgi:hypothetical protein
MSKLARTLILGAALAAMNLAGMTAVAQAQPPDAVEQFRRGERASQEQPTAAEAVERFRRGERASQAQPAIADDTRRPPSEAQVGESWRQPVNVPVQHAEPSGQPVSLVAWLGALTALLALAGGLLVLVARRAGGKVPAGQAG